EQCLVDGDAVRPERRPLRRCTGGMHAHRAAAAGALAVIVTGGAAVACVLVDRGSSATGAGTCHVTHPNGRTAPGERPVLGGYGNDRLWTAVPRDGRMVVKNDYPFPPGTFPC